ncbi:MAG TPA: dATP/dGTP diphosphohydrolase domain-containing protein [Gemmatimonadales bacterium]|nr:dATP/dGTP diphosphohydrolase domain-containing protein [Gemmatimonadales bacterium]
MGVNYDLHDTETRVRDETSGGEKGAKLTQVGALDPVALIEVARVAGFGANKYAAFNYLRGYDWSLSFNAMQRHALLFWSGEDVDEESQRLHIAMAAWHALALVSFLVRDVGNDDRPPSLPTPSDFPDIDPVTGRVSSRV